MAHRTNRTPKKDALFLAALRTSGNVTIAAEAAGYARRSVYEWRDADPDFSAAWDDALGEAADRLEIEARRRAHDGIDEPVVSGGKLVMVDEPVINPETGEAMTVRVPLLVRKYSDTLLIFLMKGANPEKYRDRQQVEHTGQIGYKVYERSDDFDPESA